MVRINTELGLIITNIIGEEIEMGKEGKGWGGVEVERMVARMF